MIGRARFLALVLLLAGCSVKATRSVPPPVTQPGFAGLIGVGREDITPPVGIFSRSWGAAKHDVADRVHRPFTATVLSIRSKEDEPPLLLAAVDLGWWRTKEDEEFVRMPLIKEAGGDAARVIVNLSHTHAGPSICREDRDKPGGQHIEGYLTKVRDALLAAARKAVASETPAVLDWRYGRCDLASNRDLADPHKERIITGFNPTEPADDTLLVGRVESIEGGRTLAVIVNYACHPTTLAWECKALSPDYVGLMRESIEFANLGAKCLFLQGNSGELAPRDNYSGDPVVADANGKILAFAALSTLQSMLPAATRLEYAGAVESGAPLATWKYAVHPPSTVLRAMKLDVEYQLKPLDQLPSSAELERQMKATDDRVMKERLLRKMRVRRVVGEGATAKVPLWVWRLGDAFIVAQPNESYSNLQQTLRELSPDRPVASLNLSNGSIGYLATPELHAHDIYQVWQSPFAKGSLERLIAAASGAILELGR